MKRYCPFCKKLLLKVHEDGRFDLAGNASVSFRIGLAPGAVSEVDPDTALCLRWICRLRRKLKGA